MSLPTIQTGEKDDVPSTRLITRDDVDRLRSTILEKEKRQTLKVILNEHGNEPLFEYIKGYTTPFLIPPNHARQKEFIAAFHAAVASRLGQDAADAGARQLEKYYYVSTTDHYGPLHHPWVLNFNLAAAGAYLEHDDPDLKNIITLACSNVSLNNFSFPRGFEFLTAPGGAVRHERLSFLPSNAHSYPVFDFRAYTTADLKKMKILLHEMTGRREVAKTVTARVEEILDDIYGRDDVLQCKNYADQVTKTNFLLWQRLCPGTEKKSINFIYVEQERIVADLFITHHLTEPTILHKMLFDTAVSHQFIQHFDGLPESFSTVKGTGTYLFWYVVPTCKKHRLRLWRENGFLVAEGGKYRIPLTPEGIREGIESGVLLPSVLLTFLTMACYYGVTCLGGMGQTSYMPKIKDAYIALNRMYGEEENIRMAEHMQPRYLGGEVTAAFVGGPHDIFAPASSIDLLIYATHSFPCVVDKTKKITLQEALDLLLPEDYPLHYFKKDMDPILARISSRDIAKLTGLDRKIDPCAFLPEELST
ncbi:MAG: hypothetical protein AAB932_02875 [Patescibacteria group bacterium]